MEVLPDSSTVPEQMGIFRPQDILAASKSDLVFLVDTSGSMQSSIPRNSGILEGFLSMFREGETKLQLAARSISQVVEHFPNHSIRVGSYSAGHCRQLPEFISGTNFEGEYSLKHQNREHLAFCLQNGDELFRESSLSDKRIIVIGDLDEACQTSFNLCGLVEKLEEKGISVSFYLFAVHSYYLEQFPCLSRYGTNLVAEMN